MSKKTATATAVSFVTDVTPTGFKDAAYRSALTSETLESIARWINTECPTFLNEVPDSIKAELKDGFALRWQELPKNKAVTYDSNTWIPKESGDISVTLAYCLSYSQQAFGQLKADHPVQHGVIGKIRTDFNKYVSNKMADLRRAVQRVQNENKPRTRTQAALFDAFLKDEFDKMKARCKTAKAREDATAPDEVKLRMAIDAFYATLK